MQDVERGLVFHARQGPVGPVEVFEHVFGVIPLESQLDPAVVALDDSDGAARAHAGAVPHRLGDHDLPFRPDFRRTDPVQRDPVSYHLTPHVLPMANGITPEHRWHLLSYVLETLQETTA